MAVIQCVAGLVALFLSQSALAHGIAGNRYFPGTRSCSKARPESTGKLSCREGVCDALATAESDPGRVKTPKGRSRRGIVFYRRRSFPSRLAIAFEEAEGGRKDRSTYSSRLSVLTRPRP